MKSDRSLHPNTNRSNRMAIRDYVTLGQSGLRVSPLCLGTMTFGTEWGLGNTEEESRAIFRQFFEAGGNFVDTANVYNFGTSEKMLGKFIKEDGIRNRTVLATKYAFNLFPGDPNGGGNGRKSIYQALDASLERLQTDYIDLYWLHAWDAITPPEEVLSTMNDLVRAGKIRYYGFSNTPAWFVTYIQIMAGLLGKEKLIALQLQYSLAERTIEREHIPAAQRLGLGICPWSPLSGGFFTGKYKREASGALGAGRLTGAGESILKGMPERSWRTLDVVFEVAKELSKTPAQVALNWAAKRPGITSPLIGATKPSQLTENLAALDFEIPAELAARLTEASEPELTGVYRYFTGLEHARICGDTSIQAWAPASHLTGAPHRPPTEL